MIGMVVHGLDPPWFYRSEVFSGCPVGSSHKIWLHWWAAVHFGSSLSLKSNMSDNLQDHIFLGPMSSRPIGSWLSWLNCATISAFSVWMFDVWAEELNEDEELLVLELGISGTPSDDFFPSHPASSTAQWGIWWHFYLYRREVSGACGYIQSWGQVKSCMECALAWLQDLQVYQTYSGYMADCLKDVITCPYLCARRSWLDTGWKIYETSPSGSRSSEKLGFAAMDVLMSKLSFEHLGKSFWMRFLLPESPAASQLDLKIAASNLWLRAARGGGSCLLGIPAVSWESKQRGSWTPCCFSTTKQHSCAIGVMSHHMWHIDACSELEDVRHVILAECHVVYKLGGLKQATVHKSWHFFLPKHSNFIEENKLNSIVLLVDTPNCQ